ncbi:MAG: type II toxin-antitoxin system RelE/ParE family toxin [Deltaproteobacteria bacterium]|nr:type II toxin-antitoxin system RelE/ParE family toxin [Deltaproteobacteria bacterium]
MLKKILIHDKAQNELWEAYEYYELQKEELGDRLLGELYNSIRTIVEFPNTGKIMPGGQRQFLLKRFPYGIIYSVKEESILYILAIIHLKRKPNYWISRLHS